MPELTATAGVPLALLPVRVETRTSPDGAFLRVRIWPDDIHIETLDRRLSAAERQAGLDYWGAVWESAAGRGSTVEARSALQAAVGPTRAAWVVEATRPRNVGRRPDEPPDPPPLGPERDDKPRPHVVRTLPDFFVVQLEQAGRLQRAEGRAVPDELVVSLFGDELPDPAELEGRLASGESPIDPRARWMVDYATARDVGMAVDVPLPNRTDSPVTRLVVMGVKSSLAPRDAARRLEELLVAHQFTGGADLLPLGTPTNNTDRSRSGWSRFDAPPPLPIDATAPPVDSDAAVAARALGVAAAALAGWAHAVDRSQARAGAFVTALWPTTWGTYLNDHIRPKSSGGTVSPEEIEAAQGHAEAYLRARGPLPLLRIGKQPYGVLPVMAIDRLAGDGSVMEDRLAPFLDRVRGLWREAVATVPTVMSGDIDRQLPDVLRAHPVSVGVNVRSVVTSLRSYDTTVAGMGIADGSDAQRAANAIAWGMLGVEATKVKSDGLLGRADRQLTIPLTDGADVAFVESLIRRLDTGHDDRVPATSLLQALLAHAVEEAISARDRLGSRSEMRAALIAVARTRGEELGIDAERLFASIPPEGDDVLPDPSELEAFAEAAHRIRAVVGEERPLDISGLLARSLVPPQKPISALSLLTDGLRRPEAQMAADPVAVQVVGEWLLATTRRRTMRDALVEIAGIADEEQRRLHLCEYLDVCSHRLDAWVTSLATRRLDRLRRTAAGSAGVVLGGYAWLENIDLTPPTPVPATELPAGVEGPLLAEPHPGGFVHAPSLGHAATAAILRAGRLTHKDADPNFSALDLDLSSAQVRTALHIIGGVRRGQPLGALLGYRFERRLHERGLDRFIYPLRGLAPLLDGKHPGRAEPEEAIAASNVVDGLRLIDAGWDAVAQKATQGPKDLRFMPGQEWVTTPADIAGVKAVWNELVRDLDAVADVLLAESVHQLVQGNTARGASTLDVLGAGEAIPPDPSVVRTPATGTALRHQVLVVVPDAAGGWDATAPRAQADPSLEAWAAAQLGPRAAYPLVDQAGLAALDVVYESDGEALARSTLGWRLRAVFDATVDELAPLMPLWEVARAVRAVLAGSRTVTTGADAVDLRNRAGQAVDRLRNAAVDGLDALQTVAMLGRHGVALGTVPETDLPPAALESLAAAMGADRLRRLARADALLDEADAATGPPATVRAIVIERSLDVFEVVLGQGFRVVAPTAEVLTVDVMPDGVAQVATARPGVGDGRHVRPWLARLAAVRPALDRYGRSLLVREAVGGRRLQLRVAQHGWEPWVGGLFPPDVEPPKGPVHHLVVETVAGDLPGGDASAGALVVDGWSETVPRQVPDAPPVPAPPAATGLAIGANGPNARAPQAILLAVSPDGRTWTEEALSHTLVDTLALAKERAVSLDKVPWAGRVLPALYFHDWSFYGRPVLDYAEMAVALDSTAAALRYVTKE